MASPQANTRLKPAVNSFVSSLLYACEASSVLGFLVRCVTWLVFIAGFGAGGLGIWFCRHNLHVRFWLQDMPLVTLLVMETTLCLAAFLLVYKAVINASRAIRRGGNFPCMLSTRTVRFLFLVITLLAFATVVLGALTVRFSDVIAESLGVRCGVSGVSRGLEQMYQQLAIFRARCSSSAGKVMNVDQCDGFSQAFPPPSPYVRYLKILEGQFGCSGFCRHNSPGLFDSAGTPPGLQVSCSVSLSQFLWKYSQLLTVPAIALGSFLSLAGAALYSYDEL